MHIFREPDSWNVSTGTSRSPGPEHAWYKWLNGSRNSETWFPEDKIPISGMMKVGLGVFEYCTHSRRLISKDSIFSPNFSCGSSYAERALWCRDSKRRALGNYFPVRIYYEFLISKCRRDWYLGLCTFWVLSFINLLSDGKIRFFLRAKRVFFRKSLLLSGSIFASTQKMHRPRSQSPLHFDIRNI